jgi:hypothetical protein
MSATASVSIAASQFWKDPLGFNVTHRDSGATMFDLLGEKKILCLVILPKKDKYGFYRGDRILKPGWEKILNKDGKVTGYKNKKDGSKTDADLNDIEFPFSCSYPFMYENPVVKYAFYALVPVKQEHTYALIGSNGTSKPLLSDVEDTCLPFPDKMRIGDKDLDYSPEQFPNVTKYHKNKNPTLVEFSEFLKENPTVDCFYLKYDDGPEMQARRSDETKASAAAAEANAADRRYQNSLNGGPPIDQRELGHGHNGGYTQIGGGGPKYVVPTINASMLSSHGDHLMKNHGDTMIDSRIDLNRYILDQFGITAFTEKIKKFYDEFFGTEYQNKVKVSRTAMVDKRLKEYINAIPSAKKISSLPTWLVGEAKKTMDNSNPKNIVEYAMTYVNGDKEVKFSFLSPFERNDRTKDIVMLKEQIDQQRIDLKKKERDIIKKFNQDAILQFPYTLSEVNTGLANLMKNEEVQRRKYFHLRSSICCLFFDKSFENVLLTLGIDFNTFEIFRESNNPNSNLLKAMCKIIADIDAQLATSPDPLSLANGHQGWADFSKHPDNVPSDKTDTSASPELGPGWVADFSEYPKNQGTPPVAQAAPPVAPDTQVAQPELFWKHAPNALAGAGGGIGKPYGKKNRKRYSRKNRKRYSGKNRKRYSGKNRKRYSGKNRKRYSGKNKKRYSKKNRK